MKSCRSSVQPSAWIYQRIGHSLGVEASNWQGLHSPPLSTHFHNEVQISLVQSGRRYFQVGLLEFEVEAGSLAIIPAGIPHKSIGVGRLQTRSRDMFVESHRLPAVYSTQITIAACSVPALQSLNSEIDGLIKALSTSCLHSLDIPFDNAFCRHAVKAVCTTDITIAELAEDARLSREGFIRRFRREMGMTPHAYRVAYKATQARHLLRSDIALAEVAAEVGFADQSHFGRIFLRKFGTTPGAYKRVWLD